MVTQIWTIWTAAIGLVIFTIGAIIAVSAHEEMVCFKGVSLEIVGGVIVLASEIVMVATGAY